jgi:hypothetical protein
MSTPEERPPEDPRRRRLLASGALALEDFRSVRRWLVMLGLITVIAFGLAAYAVIKAQESEEESADRDRVAALAATLQDRLARLDRQQRRASEETDVRRLERQAQLDISKLDRRLRRIEDDVTDSVDAAGENGDAIGRLDERLDRLERRGR